MSQKNVKEVSHPLLQVEILETNSKPHEANPINEKIDMKYQGLTDCCQNHSQGKKSHSKPIVRHMEKIERSTTWLLLLKSLKQVYYKYVVLV